LQNLLFKIDVTTSLGEKRHAEEPPTLTEEPRKKKIIEGDVPTEVIAEILEVTSDPKKMLGPDVSYNLFLSNMHLFIRFTLCVKFAEQFG